MSLTARLTPYDAEEMEREREATERELAERARERERAQKRRQARQQERLKTHHIDLTGPARVPLHIGSLESLSSAAVELGYRRVDLTELHVRLERAGGEVVELRQRGRKTEAIANQRGAAVQEIVRQHSVDRAVEHLRKCGLEVRVRRLANGEVQIEGVEQSRASVQPARLGVEVRKDGRMEVDVNCVTGDLCGQMVADLAHAVGVVAEDSRRKPEYFQQPLLQKQRQRIK